VGPAAVAAERRDLFPAQHTAADAGASGAGPGGFRQPAEKARAEGELAAPWRRAGWDGPDILRPAADLHDFSDTAALIENLDLVITVDTSVAHLAGALGKPVWILKPFRQLLAVDARPLGQPLVPDGPPVSARKSFGDWTPVVQAVAEALTTFEPAAGNMSLRPKKDARSSNRARVCSRPAPHRIVGMTNPPPSAPSSGPSGRGSPS